jgi:hypothetical protein
MHKPTLVPARSIAHFARSASLAIAFLVALVSSAFEAQAQRSGKWGDVGGWEIRVDGSVGNGCFAMQEYEDGSVVRIGVDVDNKRLYLFFANNSWKSLEQGKIYPVRVVFDGVSAYNGEMTGHRLSGGAMVLAHRNLNSDFVKDFMLRNGMRIYYQGSQIAHLSLRNTYAAITEVTNCQSEFGYGSGSSRGPGGSSRDPFR